MYLSGGWTFLVELAGDPPLATKGTCIVDMSSTEDRGDIEPFVDHDGILHCTLGCECDGPEFERREIVEVHEYKPGKPFNGKFLFFEPVSLVDFVRRFCDAATFDDETEEGIKMLKEKYGV